VGQAVDNSYYYNPAGASANEWQYAYITPNGHLQLRTGTRPTAGPAPAYASDISTINATSPRWPPRLSWPRYPASWAQASLTAFNALSTTVELWRLSQCQLPGHSRRQPATSSRMLCLRRNAAAPQSRFHLASRATLATQVSVANLSTIVSTLQTGQATKADLVAARCRSTSCQPPDQQITNLTATIATLAPLVSATVPLTNLPSCDFQDHRTGFTLALKATSSRPGPDQQLPSLSVNQASPRPTGPPCWRCPGLVGDIAIITGTSIRLLHSGVTPHQSSATGS